MNHECEEPHMFSGPYGPAWHRICIDMHGGLPGVRGERLGEHLEPHPFIYHDCDRLPCGPRWGLLDHLPQHKEQEVPERRAPTALPSLYH